MFGFRTLLVRALVVTTLVWEGGAFAAETAPSRAKLGETVDLAALLKDSGQQVTLPTDKPVVVAFLSFECPVARDYLTTLSALVKEVSVLGFVPTDEAAADIAKKVREYKVTFPVLSDAKHSAVAAFSAEYTPEVFVLDDKGVLRYRGRIDDKYGERLKPNAKITHHDLRAALDKVLTGQPVITPTTRPVGCPIMALEPAKSPTGTITYHRDILPLLQSHCQECHRPGEVGPFSLMTYKQAVTWASDIKDYTATRKMPPWSPTAGVAFQHDRRLPAAAIKTFAAWVDGGTPEGNPKDAPPAKKFPEGWALGEPDLILEMDADTQLAANGPDHFRCVVLPTGLTEDKFITAFEVRPGNPKVLHHSVNYFDLSGTARQLAKQAKPSGADRGPGYESPMGIGFTPKKSDDVGIFGGWTPGMRGVKTFQGTGYRLPKGADVVLQLHYHRTGKPETDRTKVGLYFAKKMDLKPVKIVTIPGMVSPSDGYQKFDVIPAGRKAFRVVGKVVLEEDCDAYAVLPHMHMLGKNIRVTMQAPGGSEQPIVAIDQWDYNWQEVYNFTKPLPLKSGTVLTVEAEFDNSAKNPHNPSSPPIDVKKGEETTDEMLFAFLRVTTAHGGDVKVRYLTEKKDYQTRIRDVIYGRKDGLVQTLDVFRPTGKPNGAGVMVVVSLGFRSSIEYTQPEYFQEFLRRGYTVFAVTHGSSPQFTLPDMRDDLRRAARFIRYHADEYGIDPDRLGAAGASSGGLLALLLGAPLAGDPQALDPIDRSPIQMRAVATFFPPTDYLNYGQAERRIAHTTIPAPYAGAFDFREYDPDTGRYVRLQDWVQHSSPFVRAAGLAKQQAVLAAVSPVEWVNPKFAPTLIVHGDRDNVVPYQQAERMTAKLKEHGVPHKLETKRGYGHGWLTLANDTKLLADWFDEHLRK